MSSEEEEEEVSDGTSAYTSDDDSDHGGCADIDEPWTEFAARWIDATIARTECFVNGRYRHVAGRGGTLQHVSTAAFFERYMMKPSFVSSNVDTEQDKNAFRMPSDMSSESLRLELGVAQSDIIAWALARIQVARAPGRRQSVTVEDAMVAFEMAWRVLDGRQPYSERILLDLALAVVYAGDGRFSVFSEAVGDELVQRAWAVVEEIAGEIESQQPSEAAVAEAAKNNDARPRARRAVHKEAAMRLHRAEVLKYEALNERRKRGADIIIDRDTREIFFDPVVACVLYTRLRYPRIFVEDFVSLHECADAPVLHDCVSGVRALLQDAFKAMVVTDQTESSIREIAAYLRMDLLGFQFAYRRSRVTKVITAYDALRTVMSINGLDAFEEELRTRFAYVSENKLDGFEGDETSGRLPDEWILISVWRIFYEAVNVDFFRSYVVPESRLMECQPVLMDITNPGGVRVPLMVQMRGVWFVQHADTMEIGTASAPAAVLLRCDDCMHAIATWFHVFNVYRDAMPRDCLDPNRVHNTVEMHDSFVSMGRGMRRASADAERPRVAMPPWPGPNMLLPTTTTDGSETRRRIADADTSYRDGPIVRPEVASWGGLVSDRDHADICANLQFQLPVREGE